jgi:signal transduction histidine kinase
VSPTTTSSREIRQPFRPRARVLRLLGDELIGSPRLAVFELVKNAYDADASRVTIRLDLRRKMPPTITVQDDGEGMSLDILQNVWLVPGDDHREKQRQAQTRSPKHHRLPLGEKGLGRFAVHKLGNRIEVVTRAKGAEECVVDINWNELIDKPFLDEAAVAIRVRKPQVFTGTRTGTRIVIHELRTAWTRGEVRRLQRQITSVSSPFQEPSGFDARLEVPGEEDWIADIPDVEQILGRAIWKFTFSLHDGAFDWTYEFRKIRGLKLEGRRKQAEADKLKLPPAAGDPRGEGKVVADASTTEGIGPVSGEFYVYDRDREVLRRLTDVQLLTDYLDDNGGIRIYRDGMRVYNYGEPGDDWLGLDLRRVNAPTRGISRNIILGAVHLSLATSTSLREKTNREGFVEDAAAERLRRIVLGALATLESERQIDKDHIRALTAQTSDPETAKIQKPITELRQALEKKGLTKNFEPYVAKIEHDYKDMQETLLSAGMSGLNLAVIFHEVERGVRALHEVIADGKNPEEAERQAKDLMHLLDGFSTLLRRDSRLKHSARKLIEAARRFSVLRLRHHRVDLVAPLLEGSSQGFEARFSFSLVLGALNNLIDNSLYWMRVRWPDVPPDGKPSPRRLYIGPSEDLDGPAIVVADTGTGFQDDPDRVVRPFFTRKPSGMGLGMYYANLAMELNSGQLVFPAPGDVDLPNGFDGAVVALVFKPLK